MKRKTTMNRPIIDPNTLTEEQREAIRESINNLKEISLCLCGFKYRLINTEDVESAFHRLFGKDF